jgi:probable HAF family extracellular repeat protein
LAVNGADQVVGFSANASGDNRAFMYTPGVGMLDLGTYSGGRTATATAVNSAGQAAGHSTSSMAGFFHAVLWSGGVVTDLGVLPGYAVSDAVGINASGVVAATATATLQGGATRAFVWASGQRTDLGEIPGAPAGASSQAFAINDAGEVVGTAQGLAGSVAFAWQGGPMMELAYQNGWVPEAINTSGDIVGRTSNRAVLWSGGVGADLTALIDPTGHWTLSDAVGVNDAGQIAAIGTNQLGQTRGLLLTPVPEPSALALAAAAAAGLTSRRIWRRSIHRC